MACRRVDCLQQGSVGRISVPREERVGCWVNHEDFEEGGGEEDFGDVFGGDVDADDLGAGGGEVGVNRMNVMMINSKTPSNVISARCCESRTGKLHHLVASAVVALSREVKCLRQR